MNPKLGKNKDTAMGAEDDFGSLVARAQIMRESLGRSQAITDSMITILGSFDHRLSTLETAMRPTQVLNFPLSLICYLVGLLFLSLRG